MKSIKFKKLFLVIFILYSTNSFAQHGKNNYGTHYLAGFGIGFATGIVHPTPKSALLSSIMCGVGAGLAKEVLDYHYYKTRFSTNDFLFTASGALTSGIITYFIKRNKIRRVKIIN